MFRVLASGCLKAQAVIAELIPTLSKSREVSATVRGSYTAQEKQTPDVCPLLLPVCFLLGSQCNGTDGKEGLNLSKRHQRKVPGDQQRSTDVRKRKTKPKSSLEMAT